MRLAKDLLKLKMGELSCVHEESIVAKTLEQCFLPDSVSHSLRVLWYVSAMVDCSERPDSPDLAATEGVESLRSVACLKRPLVDSFLDLWVLESTVRVPVLLPAFEKHQEKSNNCCQHKAAHFSWIRQHLCVRQHCHAPLQVRCKL